MVFEDFLAKKCDIVQNAVHEMIVSITGQDDWDMEVIGPLSDTVVDCLRANHLPACYPAYIDDENPAEQVPIIGENAGEGVPCYLSKERCQFCSYNESSPDVSKFQEIILTAFDNDACEIIDFDETEYGEERAWFYLDDDTSIELCHETHALDEEYSFYSVRRHCSDEDFENDAYHSTMGIISQDICDTLADAIESVRYLLGQSHF